eukprot:GHVQ01030643.1.p1 GENE.GHVQ01030643.1~~GHVQ01030643.1.p1  ORF type:complete len:276 (+),score=37.75 GHVQ01030643.1:505-1332(+)
MDPRLSYDYYPSVSQEKQKLSQTRGCDYPIYSSGSTCYELTAPPPPPRRTRAIPCSLEGHCPSVPCLPPSDTPASCIWSLPSSRHVSINSTSTYDTLPPHLSRPWNNDKAGVSYPDEDSRLSSCSTDYARPNHMTATICETDDSMIPQSAATCDSTSGPLQTCLNSCSQREAARRHHVQPSSPLLHGGGFLTTHGRKIERKKAERRSVETVLNWRDSEKSDIPIKESLNCCDFPPPHCVSVTRHRPVSREPVMECALLIVISRTQHTQNRVLYAR